MKIARTIQFNNFDEAINAIGVCQISLIGLPILQQESAEATSSLLCGFASRLQESPPPDAETVDAWLQAIFKAVQPLDIPLSTLSTVEQLLLSGDPVHFREETDEKFEEIPDYAFPKRVVRPFSEVDFFFLSNINSNSVNVDIATLLECLKNGCTQIQLLAILAIKALGLQYNDTFQMCLQNIADDVSLSKHVNDAAKGLLTNKV